MAVEVVNTCPLGSKCEEIVDGKIHRCRLYIMMKGKDAQGEEHDDWNCSFAWQPIIQLEAARQTRNLGADIESFRNENTARQQTAFSALQYIKDITPQECEIKGIQNGNEENSS